MNKTVAILLAAGKSERFGNCIPKPFLQLKGKAVYHYGLDVFMDHGQIDAVYLIVPEQLLLLEKEKLKNENFPKPIHLIAGGDTRFDSVNNALKHIDKTVKSVLIHDAARPFITKKLIDNCLENLIQNKAITCAIESTDTNVVSDAKGNADSYPDRSKIMRIQTPQAFHLNILKKAYSIALKETKSDFTDDSSLIHFYGLAPVFLVPGSEQNIKITYPTDLLLAEFILNGLKKRVGK